MTKIAYRGKFPRRNNSYKMAVTVMSNLSSAVRLLITFACVSFCLSINLYSCEFKAFFCFLYFNAFLLLYISSSAVLLVYTPHMFSFYLYGKLSYKLAAK